MQGNVFTKHAWLIMLMCLPQKNNQNQDVHEVAAQKEINNYQI